MRHGNITHNLRHCRMMASEATTHYAVRAAMRASQYAEALDALGIDRV